MKGLQWIATLVGVISNLLAKGIWGNALAMLMVGVGIAWAGKTYVDQKHYDITAKVEANTKQVSDMEKMQIQVNGTLAVVGTSLENVSKSMDGLQKSVEKLDQRIYDLQKR